MTQVRDGFTLIELLIVMMIIGLLASIAIPKFSSVRENSYITAVLSDLNIMSTQMEIYQAQNLTYPATVALLTDFTGTPNVIITITETVSGSGWAATGYHSALTARQCGIFYGSGSASNAVPATEAGIVVCQ